MQDVGEEKANRDIKLHKLCSRFGKQRRNALLSPVIVMWRPIICMPCAGVPVTLTTEQGQRNATS